MFATLDRGTRWDFMRIYADQSEGSSNDFLHRLKAVAPMKIEKLVTDTGSQFTYRFRTKTKSPSGNHVFDCECGPLGIEHRLTKPRHRQSIGVVERFNGPISGILAPTRFRSREGLQATLDRYQTLYDAVRSER